MCDSKEPFVNGTILSIRNLKKYFPVRSAFLKRRIGWLRAVDDVSFDVLSGELLGLVGESGCGKSTLGKTILGTYKPDGGEVIFKNRDISILPPEEKRKVRREIQYVYQDAAASLDSWWSVGRLLCEPLVIHTHMSQSEMDEKVVGLLQAVGLRGEDVHRYPHEFSGGQQRRLGLARILTLNPELIIFDEPTAGLDVSVQAKILELLIDLKDMFHLTYIVISHNLSVIRMICNRTAVMYLGRIVETSSTQKVFENPIHPYTRALLDAIPEVGERRKHDKLLLRGEPPSPEKLPPGCRFQPRCPFKKDSCEREEPDLEQVEPGHWAACHIQ